MPVIAIMIDLGAWIVYEFQRQFSIQGVYLVGLILQSCFVLLLTYFSFGYQGKRFAKIQPYLFYRYLSIRYSVILISLFLNGVLLFLYVIHYLGINPLVFS